HFPQLCKVFKAHISSQNTELSNAALQALGFCVFNSNTTSELPATEIHDLLSMVNSVAVKTSDKNTRTRALWVISKQAFPSEIVKKEVSNIISALETILTKGDVQSMVVEYEALNVIIRLMEQAPAQMGEEAVRWAKLIIPLVVHSAHKVQLRGATALEMGMPLLLQKQQEVAAVTEHLMTTKIISELQKLFSTKNETYVLKLWPLFVKLLGKTLHRSGSFINSLLQLEELGFRSGSPVVKKIAFIAWKSLIDNFALNPDILCSAKRLKLLMQPLSSIHVRTEALALTKLEVWWYLLMRLGPQLPANFEQVCVPLIQSTLSPDSSAALQGTPLRPYPFASPVTPRLNLNSSTAGVVMIPSIQLLGIEMLLHFLMGSEVLEFAKQNKLVLSLEPLQYPLISSPSFFCKHASTLINAVQDGFIAIGKEIPDCMLNVIWKDINGYVKTAIESGNKKEKQGSEVLTMLLQALKNTVRSNCLPVQKILSLIDITVKELPPKILGSPAYQVADMDLLNGTPALFLIQLPFHNNLLECCVTDERFFVILETLVGYVLSGPTSPLAFSESVICIINQSAKQVENKEHLWRMWSIVVNPLTEWINRTNEVNQGDALEHNFNAVYSALLLPVLHIFPFQEFPQPTMKSLLRTWSDLYRAFARCAALVATAEENLCCEELCAKIISGLEGETPMFSMMDGLTHIMSVMVDCINFAPYGTKYQPKNRSPQTPTDWSKKKKEPLGKLASLFKLLVMLLNSFHVFSSKETCSETLVSVSPSIIAILHNIISHVSLPSVIGTMFAIFSKPLAVFYEETKKKLIVSSLSQLEKLLAEIILCLQSHCTGSYDSELLEQLSPLLCVMFQHKSKQIRNQCAHFWNTTFAKTTSLTYPEELKSVLSQAKKKIPLLLPGFESIEVAEDCSGPFSDVVSILLTPSGCFIVCNFMGAVQKVAARSVLISTVISLEGLEKNTVETASKEPLGGNKNTSNVSNSSTSSDVISGTPQPASRRQSFITLEKFGSSENRPFSLSALNSLSEMSGSASVAGKQKNTNVCKTSAKPEKSGEDDKKPSKSESEQIFTAIRRLTRRQSKMEHQGYKQSKLLIRSEQEKNARESFASSSMENSPELSVSVEDMEFVLLAQSQALHSTDLEIKKVEDTITEIEKVQALDTDSKENTPPETTVSSDQVTGDDSQVPHVSPNQKILRRSSRRRSESLESTAGSQDKEDGHQKRDRRKDDEKSGQKKVPQTKDDVSQKQKAVSGKTAENTNKKESNLPESSAAEDSNSKESPASGGLDEVNRSIIKCPRYHTRRASQGLLSSIENSEADGSETKEESTRKKRSAKVKNKSDSLEGKSKDRQPGTASKAVESASSKSSPDALDANVEQNKSNTSIELFTNPCVFDQDLKAAEENKQTNIEDYCSAVLTEFVLGANASGGDLSSSQIPDCQHKRSKRLKRLRNCGGCKKSKRQVMSFTDSKNETTLKLNKPQTTPVQMSVNTSEMSSNSNFDESLSIAPCAMSTPLHPPKEPSAFNLERERTSEDDLQGSSGVVEEDLENLECKAGEVTESRADIKEPADQSDRPEQCQSACVSDEPGDSCWAAGSQSEEPAATEKEEISQKGQLEEIPKALVVVSKPEKKQMNGLEGNQDDKEAAENAVGETGIIQDKEMKEELVETEITVPENVALDKEDAVANNSMDSPQKPEDHDSLALVNESPNGMQARCMWSPSASPSTSILKRGIKRNQDDDCLSPANKIRRVSFANPIYQEGLADDIDRRSPVIRSHSSSPSSRNLKILSNIQAKHITTPTKGFLSPGSRNPKFKSSKKCLITEMAKESLPCPTECMYPALVGCKAPVDVILPQITSNICARGLGQLIRAKNIKTVGDLSILTASEIKTLPIRSPKVSNVRKALKGYHEQQVKSRGFEEIAALEDAEKPVNNVEDKSLSVDEEKLATDLIEPVVVNTNDQPTADLLSQIDALAAQLTSEDLHSYSGSQLFEMQEKLVGMTNCIMKNLQSRWKSPPHESSD
uniref:Replication timing regulatory factor 1 n=1 Tax=Aquila chrysaetos chrysaetos TaxID=223781 RepID=A0A663E4K0_AQUCH